MYFFGGRISAIGVVKDEKYFIAVIIFVVVVVVTALLLFDHDFLFYNILTIIFSGWAAHDYY